jgi:hypothetical protein
MTDRERWTVYPLLFLVLGITVKDKLARPARFDSIRCGSLVVEDHAGKDRVLIGSNPAGGIIQLNGDRDVRSVLFGYANNVAGLMYVDPQGNPSRWLVIPTVVPRKSPLNGPGEANRAAAGEKPADSDPPAKQQNPGEEPPLDK